jgi:hypothetical protein
MKLAFQHSLSDLSTHKHIALRLDRLYDNNDIDTGLFDIGTIAPGLEAVNNTKPIPFSAPILLPMSSVPSFLTRSCSTGRIRHLSRRSRQARQATIFLLQASSLWCSTRGIRHHSLRRSLLIPYVDGWRALYYGHKQRDICCTVHGQGQLDLYIG